MKLEKKNKVEKSKKVVSSIILYVAAVFVALIGVGLLVENIVVYNITLAHYLTQGYSAATVKQQLILSQLLPSILSSIGIYGGIAFILVAAAIINTKLSKQITKDEVLNKVDEENILENDIVKKEDLGTC
ncbi:MAG: hypothetical protein ABF633_18500 [Clostridium sp.]|uniref:hypothetical protein n=1 Tax=Clostridium sp. TaxID=1506 RepID=UPI0039EC6822